MNTDRWNQQFGEAARSLTKNGPQGFSFLDPHESEDLVRKIYELKEHWLRFQMSPPEGPEFFSLGVPSYEYAFGRRPYQDYFHRAALLNPVLKDNFSALYERLIIFFSTRLNEPVQVDGGGFSLPGFHIFISQPGLLRHPEGFHIDNQAFSMPWTEEVDPFNSITFTVALKIPTGGASLQWKALRYRYRELLQTAEGQAQFDKMKTEEVDYHLGDLLVHDGFNYHRIGPWKRLAENEARITLQGHLVKAKDHWVIYW